MENGYFVSKLFLGRNLFQKANLQENQNLLIIENMIIINLKDSGYQVYTGPTEAC